MAPNSGSTVQDLHETKMFLSSRYLDFNDNIEPAHRLNTYSFSEIAIVL